MPFKRVAGNGNVFGWNTLNPVWGRFRPKRLCRLTLPMPSKPHATFASVHREQVADRMNLSYTIGCRPCHKRRTMLLGFLSWWRRFHLLRTAWTEYFLYCISWKRWLWPFQGYKHHSWYRQVVWHTSSYQFLPTPYFCRLPVSPANIAREYPEQVGYLELGHPHGAVGIMTTPVSLIVIIPLFIMHLLFDDYILFSFFSPADIFFLRSISLSMSLEILSSVIFA